MKSLFGFLLILVGGFLGLPSAALVLLCVFSFRPGCGFSIMLVPVLAVGFAMVWGGWELAGLDDVWSKKAGSSSGGGRNENDHG